MVEALGNDRKSSTDRLGLSEAISLLSGKNLWHTQGIPDRNIASLRISDGPNGIRGIRTFNGIKTGCFPCASGLAATWDVDLLRDIGEEMGRQAKSKGVHLVLAPTINIHRSPLGGRNFEAFSEDPFLSGRLASNLICGLQGEGVGATVKHFVCNDVETDRTKVDVIVQERALREIYLKPFEIVVREAKPWAVMSSYNKVNGLHVSENSNLLNEVLRKEWGFNGLVMSDWWGTYSTTEALKATLDLEMPGPTVWRGEDRISRAISCGKLDADTVYSSANRVRALVEKAMRAGTPENADEKENNSPRYREINRKAAAASIVLLKNENNILPLQLETRPKIAIIGPNANKDVSSGGGSASVHAYYYVSALDGLSNAIQKVSPETAIYFAQGCYSDEMLPLMETKTASGDKGWDIKLYPHPFDFDVEQMTDPAVTITTESSRMFFFDCLPSVALPITWAICEGIFDPLEDGRYEFGVTTTGRAKLFLDSELLIDNWSEQKQSRAFFGMGTTEVQSSIEMKAGRSYKVLIQYSCISSFPDRKLGALGGGILRIGARRTASNSELIAEAVRVASEADIAIVCLGMDKDRESEGFDRSDMMLPNEQNLLASAVIEANPRTIFVNFSGSPVEMPWASKASAILQSWFLGSELGNGLADIMLGEVNPSARLPVSFPIKLKQNPSYGNFPGENGIIRYDEGLLVGYRHYTTREVPTLFPFGYGLSYTTFTYSSLNVESPYFSPHSKNRVTLTVTNSGLLTGDIVVQLYVSAPPGPLFRPVRQLQGFVKLHSLTPGEARSCEFSLTREHLSHWDDVKKCWVAEEGRYIISIGHCSERMALETNILVAERLEWLVRATS